MSLRLKRKERGLLAQCRIGILPLRIETGRYVDEKEDERLCIHCNKREIENKNHFLTCFPLYIERVLCMPK